MKPLTYRHTRIACYGAYVTQAIINNLAPLLFYDLSKKVRSHSGGGRQPDPD